MAAYLTGAWTYCYHDGLSVCKTKEEFDHLMSDQESLGFVDSIGNADSGLVLFDFQAFWPGIKTVIIHRSPVAVAQSLERLYGVKPLDEMVNEKAYQMEMVAGYHVQYDRLDAELESICDYLDINYDYYKHMLFKDMNIQTTKIFVDDFVPFWETA